MEWLIVGVILVVFTALWIVVSVANRHQTAPLEPGKHRVADVASFYNEHTGRFLAVYGEVIQAFRTRNIHDYLAYTIQSADLKPGLKVVDAGCGVCGPAIYFADHVPDLHIEAFSISAVQVELAKQAIDEAKRSAQIRVREGDYHQLTDYIEPQTIDRVYFLESLGHSPQPTRVIQQVWEILKPGGKIYIKDLFEREVSDAWEQAYIRKIGEDIERAYCYKILDIHQLITLLRKQGFILDFIKMPEVAMDHFEHLAISNQFQELFNIGKIESWDTYAFPIDFLEIRCTKPQYAVHESPHLYHLNQPHA